MTATVLRLRTRVEVRNPAGFVMDTTTTRVVACPNCGAAATVQLEWQPETAWVAHMLGYWCPNRCKVDAATVLRRLGLEATPKRRRRRR